jgi:hypothetical protein
MRNSHAFNVELAISLRDIQPKALASQEVHGLKAAPRSKMA